MSRLLTLLLLYRNGYEIGQCINIEKQIEKTKDAYYDVLEGADDGWYEEENAPTPFIKYMLQVIWWLCYVEFEERVGMMSAEVIVGCPGMERKLFMNAIDIRVFSV